MQLNSKSLSSSAAPHFKSSTADSSSPLVSSSAPACVLTSSTPEDRSVKTSFRTSPSPPASQLLSRHCPWSTNRTTPLERQDAPAAMRPSPTNRTGHKPDLDLHRTASLLHSVARRGRASPCAALRGPMRWPEPQVPAAASLRASYDSDGWRRHGDAAAVPQGRDGAHAAPTPAPESRGPGGACPSPEPYYLRGLGQRRQLHA